MNYEEFLKAKVPMAVEDQETTQMPVHPILKAHQVDIVRWAVKRGRAAIFASFGLGKSVMQIEIVRACLEQTEGGKGLIVAPLGVRGEFRRDAAMLGESITFIRSTEEATGPGLYITNYESVREGKLDPRAFEATSLDEAACLRGFGATKTFREFMRLFEGVRYKFVATATPSPNEFIELLAYSAYLEVMDVGEAKTRFFKRDSTKADQLTIHPHKEREFWLWVASWGIFLQRPSDLGHDDTGYALPPMHVHYHEVEVDQAEAHPNQWGQFQLFREATGGIVEAAREKRETLETRVAAVADILANMRNPDGTLQDQVVIWCDLNDEQKALEKMLKEGGYTFSSLYGNQSIDLRETLLDDWRERRTAVFLSKPVMYGAGINMQQCHTMIFAGVGYKFADFIQGVHRVYRFLQAHPVNLHIVHAESERQVLRILQDKWTRHNQTVDTMSEIIQEYGLTTAGMREALQRQMGVERVEVTGKGWTAVNNDCVIETGRMAENSVDLILTSIPFSTQYEYSPSYHDFGHTDSNQHFFEQMDYLTPNLLRVLQPGRMAAIHVKDRIVPGGLTGLGFQTVYPFHMDTINHYTKHGFAYMGMVTIVTDVVRENNQTYRLGWSEQCKDATKMGVGMPEYLLLFRKPPTSNENSYSDKPAKKSKPNCIDDDGNEIPFDLYKPIKPGTGYSRARWQLDAHGFQRSSGDRLLMPEELSNLAHDVIFKLFRDYSMTTIYDYEHHVKIGESLEGEMRLPTSFMLLQPQSSNGHVWTDVTRMRTLNGNQYSKGQQMHLCPMQFDIADRVIDRLTMPGETVLDPFGGLMTVPYRAVLKGRKGYGIELSPSYFFDGVGYCKAAEEQMSTPSLFDTFEDESELEAA
jgi:DNA modification methylase